MGSLATILLSIVLSQGEAPTGNFSSVCVVAGTGWKWDVDARGAEAGLDYPSLGYRTLPDGETYETGDQPLKRMCTDDVAPGTRVEVSVIQRCLGASRIVTAGEAPLEVELDAPPSARLHGRVVTEDGTPIKQAQVELDCDEREWRTSSTGEFELQGFTPEEELQVRVLARGYVSQKRRVTVHPPVESLPDVVMYKAALLTLHLPRGRDRALDVKIANPGGELLKYEGIKPGVQNIVLDGLPAGRVRVWFPSCPSVNEEVDLTPDRMSFLSPRLPESCLLFHVRPSRSPGLLESAP